MGSKMSLQTTVRMCYDNVHAMEVIARACWMQFEAGSSKDEVVRFRDDCYAKLKDALKGHSAKAGKGDTASSSLPAGDTAVTRMPIGSPETEGEPDVLDPPPEATVEHPVDNGAPASRAAPDASVASSVLDDVPPGHISFHKIKQISDQRGNRGFNFVFVDASGKKIPFQTTTRAAGGHDETAQRYARLCYAKFEEGWTKEQVQEFRARLYRSVEAGTSGPQPSQNEAPATTDAATETLREAKKSKKAVRREPLGNEQVKADRDEAPREEKKPKKEKKQKILDGRKEKVSEKERDDKPLEEKMERKERKEKKQKPVEDNKEKKSKKQRDDTPLEEDKVAPVTSATEQRLGDHQASPSSSSSSSSSSSKEEEEEEGVELPVAKRARQGDAVGEALEQVKVAPVSSSSWGSGRICGKTLVTSGLRCACHFDYVERCPDLMATGVA